MQYVPLGVVLSASGLAAGQVSAPSAIVPGAHTTRAVRVYVQTTGAVEVYYYTGDGAVEDWGNLLGSVGGSTGGAWATLVLNPAALGKTVKFAVKNTGGAAVNVTLRAALFKDYD